VRRPRPTRRRTSRAKRSTPNPSTSTQLYDRYTEENHAVWGELYRRRWEKLEEQASNTFIAGLNAIQLRPGRVPLLFGEAPHPTDPERSVTGINEFLRPLTGWQSRACAGLPAGKGVLRVAWRAREFPTTIVVRPKAQMDYLPEPDIFHDVFGHVPLHADQVFAEFLQTYGQGRAGRRAR
jgi:phenylalanine-4-hydroxylase